MKLLEDDEIHQNHPLIPIEVDGETPRESSEYFSDDHDYSSDLFFDFDQDLPIEQSSTSSSDGANVVNYESFIMQSDCFTRFDMAFIENQNHVLSGSTLDLVLQYLPLKDLKECSLVCKNWYNSIARTELTMEKHHLYLDCYCNDDQEEFLNLLQSNRKYSSIEMIVNNDDETMMFMTCLLLKFGKSLRKLKIVKYGGHLNFLVEPIQLDKLESIELYSVCSTMSLEFLTQCQNLKTIILDGFSEKCVKDILKQNSSVNELILYENSFVTYLNLNLPNIFMNLKTFGVLDHMTSGFTLTGEFPSDEWTISSRNMLIKFLMYQSPTLQTLQLEKVHTEDLSTILKSLPLLKNVEINKIEGDLKSLSLKNNTTIEVFISAKVHDFVLCEMIKKFQALKSLFLATIRSHQFIILWENAQQLEDFAYFWASSSERADGGPLVELNKFVENIPCENAAKFNIVRTTKKKFLKTYFRK